MATPNNIILKGTPHVKTAIANEAITPGQLLDRVGGSGSNAMYVQKHALAGQDSQRLFAIEQAYIGKGITSACAATDQIPYVTANRGDEIYAFLASGQNVNANTRLVSDGAGALTAYAPISNGSNRLESVVGVSIEAVNASGAIGRIKIEVA